MLRGWDWDVLTQGQRGGRPWKGDPAASGSAGCPASWCRAPGQPQLLLHLLPRLGHRGGIRAWQAKPDPIISPIRGKEGAGIVLRGSLQMRRAGDRDARRAASSPSITDPAVLRGVMTKKPPFWCIQCSGLGTAADELWKGDVRGGTAGLQLVPPVPGRCHTCAGSGTPPHGAVASTRPEQLWLSPAKSPCPWGTEEPPPASSAPPWRCRPRAAFLQVPSEGPLGCQGTSPAPNWHRGHGSSLPWPAPARSFPQPMMGSDERISELPFDF